MEDACCEACDGIRLPPLGLGEKAATLEISNSTTTKTQRLISIVLFYTIVVCSFYLKNYARIVVVCLFTADCTKFFSNLLDITCAVQGMEQGLVIHGIV